MAEHGQQFPIPELRQIMAADCPCMIKSTTSDLSGVHVPGLG
jgi:hypothetical protein